MKLLPVWFKSHMQGYVFSHFDLCNFDLTFIEIYLFMFSMTGCTCIPKHGVPICCGSNTIINFEISLFNFCDLDP